MAPRQFVGVGEDLPAVELLDLDGGSHSLRNYTADGVLIFMWATW